MKAGNPSPLLSIVIPAYNAGAFIADTLRSILEQDFEDYEVVVVDDASSDDTCDVVRGFSDSRIRLLDTGVNVGPPANFNRALAEASGELVYVFHADDLMLPGNLSEKVAALQEDVDLGWVYSNIIQIDEKGKEMEACWFKFPEATCRWGVRRFFDFLFAQRSCENVCAPTVMVRWECVEKAGLYETGITNAQDWNMWMRYALLYPSRYLERPLVAYRIHSGQDSAQYSSVRVVRECYLAKRYVLDRYPEEFEDVVQVGKVLRCEYAEMAMESAVEFLRRPKAKKEWFASARALVRYARELNPAVLRSRAHLRTAMKVYAGHRVIGAMRKMRGRM